MVKTYSCTHCKVEGTFRKEGHVVFNDALNTFYLRLYGVRHNMVKDQSDNERENPVSSKGYFMCIIPQTG